MLSFSTTGECFFSLLLTLSLSLLPSALSLFLGFLSSGPDEFEELEDSCTNLGASSRTSEEEERFGLRPFFPFLCDDDEEDEAAPSALLDLESCRVFFS